MKKKIAALLAASAIFSILVVAFDVMILSTLTGIQSPTLNLVMSAFTALGTVYLGVAVILLLLLSTDRKVFWDALVATMLALFFSVVLKIVIPRERPFEVGFPQLANAELGSFASVHTAEAFALFGVLGTAYKRWRYPLYAVAVIVGISRVYLDVHYPTDALTGAVVGVACTYVTLRFHLGAKLQAYIKKLSKK